MSVKVTITADNLSEVNSYLNVNVGELAALSNPALYANDDTPKATQQQQQQQLHSNDNDIDSSDMDSVSNEEYIDPLLMEDDDLTTTTQIHNFQQPLQPKVSYDPTGQIATDSSGEIVVHPDDVAQKQLKVLNGDNGDKDGIAQVTAISNAHLSASQTIDHVHNNTNTNQNGKIELIASSSNVCDIDGVGIDGGLTQNTSKDLPTQSSNSNSNQQQTRQQQQQNTTTTSGSNNPTPRNGHRDGEVVQVERIIVRKQQLQDWGQYRIDKFGRVIHETTNQVAENTKERSKMDPNESSLTHNGISPSESSSNVVVPTQHTTINTLQAQTTQIDPKALQKKLERETKWVEMVAHWDTTRDAVLKRRVRKGIPSSMRGIVWAKIMQTDDARGKHPLRYYYDLLSRPVQEQHELQIRKDLPRLMQDNIMFRSPEAGSRTVMCSGQAMLYNVLKAYSVHDPEVGYVQGMDTVAAPALLYFPEETTFWFLERLLQAPKYKLRDLYLDGFPLARKYGFIHEQLVKKYLPNLYKCMDQQCIQHTVYAFRWYSMRYAQFAPELSYRVLDIYLYEGDKILYRIALALLFLYEKKLLSQPDDLLENLKAIESDYALHSKDNGDFIINKALKINLTTAEIIKLGDLYAKLDAAGELMP